MDQKPRCLQKIKNFREKSDKLLLKLVTEVRPPKKQSVKSLVGFLHTYLSLTLITYLIQILMTLLNF